MVTSLAVTSQDPVDSGDSDPKNIGKTLIRSTLRLISLYNACADVRGNKCSHESGRSLLNDRVNRNRQYRYESETNRSVSRRWINIVLALPHTSFQPLESVKSDRKMILLQSQEKLNELVIGHGEAKRRTLSYLNSSLKSEKSNGVVLGICGPPGNGKSTLVTVGLASATKRPIIKVNLNGMHSSSYLFGVEAGIVQSGPGYLAKQLIRAGVRNPIFFV